MPTIIRKILAVIIALLMLLLIGYAGYALFAIVSLPLAVLFVVFVVITAFALLFVVLELVLNRWLGTWETRKQSWVPRIQSFLSLSKMPLFDNRAPSLTSVSGYYLKFSLASQKFP
jgi:uncharacterized membrane protein YedE/YeeE